MPKPVPHDRWGLHAVRRRWGCLISAAVLFCLVAAAFGLLVFIVRPRPALNPLPLIGSDVDGLAVIELSRSSSRVNHLLEVLVRPRSYEVQSNPEELEREASRLLDVMTFRRALCLMRFDPAAGREEWALVIPLKRMAEPLKVLVRQLAAGDQKTRIETEVSDGVLRFWGKPEMPCFAIGGPPRKRAIPLSRQPQALMVATNRPWLDEVLRRMEKPLKTTERAEELVRNLPGEGKHRIVRACVEVSRERWKYWADRNLDDQLLLEPVRLARAVLEENRVKAGEIRALALAATLEPRGQLRFDLTVSCPTTSGSLALGRQVRRNWPELAGLFHRPYVAEVMEPTTGTAGLTIGWVTPSVEQLLGLSPVEEPVVPPRR